MPYFPPQQTALDILNKIKTVDGSGSGLDADTIDGLHANELSTVASLNDLTDVTISTPSTNQVLLYNGSIWVNGTITSGVTDHGALTGLSEDDHSQYLLATGSRTGAISSRQIFTSGITTGSIRPDNDSTNALQLQQADGTAVVTVDTTNQRLGIGVTPSESLHTSGNLKIGGVFVYLNGNLFVNANGSTDIILGSNLGRNFYFRTASGANRLAMLSASGHVGVGLNPIPLTQFDCQDINSSTGAVQNAVTMRSTNAGTPGTGFGVGFRAGLKSSTTDNSDAGRLTWEWVTATHANRASRGKLSAYYTSTEQNVITWDGDTDGLKLAFYGVTPVARQLLATGAGATVDDVITALQNLGLLRQS